MQKMPPMIDMCCDDDDDDGQAGHRLSPIIKPPKYPWGLQITLTQDELEKLQLDPSEVSVGDTIHLFAFANVTGISQQDYVDEGTKVSVNLQITHLSSEDEEAEESDWKKQDDKPKAKKLYG